jgi:hypothetical protein
MLTAEIDGAQRWEEYVLAKGIVAYPRKDARNRSPE